MDKITKIIDELNETELELFERQIKEGTLHKFIERKKEFFKIKDKICPVCGNGVNEDCFVLTFGSPELRKKAHFCGVDCLEYFLKKFKFNEEKPKLKAKSKSYTKLKLKNIL